MSSESPTKPPWVTSKKGTHPAFAPLSKEDAEKMALAAIAEAQQFAEGQAMKFATPDQKILVDAERRRELHKKNAEVFAGVGNQEQEIKHRVWWAEAAIDLGKFDEAREALKSKGKIIDKDLRLYIDDVKAACMRPDTQECKCEREVAGDDNGNVIALDRRYGVKQIFSPYHNQLVTIYSCRHCGFLNASAIPPSRQAEYEAMRKKNEMAARSAISKDKPSPKGLSDAQVLKVE